MGIILHSLLNQAKEIALHLVNEVDDVDLVLAYGSLAQETADEFSDFDLLVLSDSIRVNWSFILQGRPIMLWTMTWKEAEQVAKGIQGSWCVGTAFLRNYRIFWSKSNQIEKRFRELSKYITEGSQEVLRRTITRFPYLYGHLWRLQEAINQNDTLTPPFLVWNIANAITQILSAINGNPLLHNWGNQIPEMEHFEIVPLDFISRYIQLVTSPSENVLSVATSLVTDVHSLLKTWFNDQKISESDFMHEMQNEYPGIIDGLNKIRSAVKTRNIVAVRAAAVEYTEFAIWLFKGMRGVNAEVRQFESVLDAITILSSKHQRLLRTLLVSRDFNQLLDVAEQLTNLLHSEMVNKGVKLPRVASIDEAIEFLRIEKV